MPEPRHVKVANGLRAGLAPTTNVEACFAGTDSILLLFENDHQSIVEPIELSAA
jgi:hypothetical protein